MASKKPTKLVIQNALRRQLNQLVDLPGGVFTNSSVRARFSDILSKSTFFNNRYLPIINSLIDNQLIIPVNVRQPGIFDKIKIMAGLTPTSNIQFGPSSGTMAFFDSGYGRIFMLVDNIDKQLYKPNYVAAIVLHEIQHMTCNRFTQEFYNLHRNVYVEFFSTFFDNFLDVDDKFRCRKDSIGSAMEYLIVKSEGQGNKMTEKELQQFLNMIVDSYPTKQMTSDQKRRFSKSIDDYVSVIYSLADESYYRKSRFSNTPEQVARIVLTKTYDSMKLDTFNSFVGQELWFPSELICVECESRPTNIHYVLIPKLLT